MTSRPDIYARVTEKIIADLEAGTRPWHKPWSAGTLAGRITRPLRANGVPYRGLNIILLWASAAAQGFAAPMWMTYRQAQSLGGQVRKGSRGETVVYADTLTRTETDADGQDRDVAIPFMKGYAVFNVDQIDGLPAHLYAHDVQVPEPEARHAAADAFFQATQADIRHGGDRAFYAVGPDYIQMPPFNAFEDPAAYYATLAHEAAHWTRHPTRLDRSFGRKRWGDAGYAQEELVAELSAAFLCADLGLAPEPRDEHAAYIASWLRALKNDKRFVFQAAAHAQRAVDYLHGCQPMLDDEEAAA